MGAEALLAQAADDLCNEGHAGTSSHRHELPRTARRLQQQKREKQQVNHADAVPKAPHGGVRPQEDRLWTVCSRICCAAHEAARFASSDASQLTHTAGVDLETA